MIKIPYLKPILISIGIAAWAGSVWYAREDGKDTIRAEWNEERLLLNKAQLADSEFKRGKDRTRRESS